MTDPFEALILTEANRLGLMPKAEAIRQAGIDLAGAELTCQGLISLPGKGSISPTDYVRSLHSQAPASFAAIADDKPDTKPADTLTEAMRREVAASRSRPRFTETDLARYSGMTRAHMEERLRAEQGEHR